MLGGGKQGREVKRFVQHPRKNPGKEGRLETSLATARGSPAVKPFPGAGTAKGRARM